MIYEPSPLSFKPPCHFHKLFTTLAEETIFEPITPQTTAEQYEAAKEQLERLAKRLASKVDLFHFPAVHGTHLCVQDAYDVAEVKLQNIQLMQPPPPPAPEPKQQPPPQPMNLEALLANVERVIAESANETSFGNEREEERG
jgi:hypothetical protein